MSQHTVARRPLRSSEFVSLRDAMDRFLNEGVSGSPFRTLWSAANGETGQRPLPLDVYATADEVVIVAAAAGLNPDEVSISVDQKTVTLSGQIPNAAVSEEGKSATWYLHELPSGTFQRSVSLPFEVDVSGADAVFEHGILRLRLPKAEQARPQEIKVRVGGTLTPPESQPEAITEG